MVRSQKRRKRPLGLMVRRCMRYTWLRTATLVRSKLACVRGEKERVEVSVTESRSEGHE